MTKQELIDLLQEDLKNERKHMLFYLQAGVMVQGLHREEIGEFLLKEALDEHKHVEEFSRLIVQLGGIPGQEVNSFTANMTCPKQILLYAQNMEQEVSNIYSKRLQMTCNPSPEEGGIETYVNLFYEDQLQDSQSTALEIGLLIAPYFY
jgi:bacterioferritin (cytochrome b1)